MKTKRGMVFRAIVCGWLLLAGSSSWAGVDPQVYAQPEVGHEQPLMQSVAGWLSRFALPDTDQVPSFRWIRTTPVADDPRLQQTETGESAHWLVAVPGVGKQQRVVASNNMFQRLENAPAATSTRDFSQIRGRGGQISQPPNLALSANIPGGLQVNDADVVWHIRSQVNGSSQQLGGRNLQLALPEGSYAVSLHIGAYEESRAVNVAPGSVAAPVFSTQIGRLRVSSNHQADWRVVAVSGTAAGHTLLEDRGSGSISQILPVGEYDVVAAVNSASQTRRVQVSSGKVSTASIQVPTGQVNLVATLGNSPAMRPMRWTLYRLDGGRQEIASPRRHSAILVVSPGHYEAVANLDGRERRREFTVLNGSSNNIVLAMD